MDDFQLLRFSFICRNNWGECLTTRYAVLDRWKRGEAKTAQRRHYRIKKVII